MLHRDIFVPKRLGFLLGLFQQQTETSRNIHLIGGPRRIRNFWKGVEFLLKILPEIFSTDFRSIENRSGEPLFLLQDGQ